MDEEEVKIKMHDGVDTAFASEGIGLFLLTCGRSSLVSGTQMNYPVRDD